MKDDDLGGARENLDLLRVERVDLGVDRHHHQVLPPDAQPLDQRVADLLLQIAVPQRLGQLADGPPPPLPFQQEVCVGGLPGRFVLFLVVRALRPATRGQTGRAWVLPSPPTIGGGGSGEGRGLAAAFLLLVVVVVLEADPAASRAGVWHTRSPTPFRTGGEDLLLVDPDYLGKANTLRGTDGGSGVMVIGRKEEHRDLRELRGHRGGERLWDPDYLSEGEVEGSQMYDCGNGVHGHGWEEEPFRNSELWGRGEWGEKGWWGEQG